MFSFMSEYIGMTIMLAIVLFALAKGG